MLVAAASGVISNIAGATSSYANTRGKGGPATALVETSPAVQTLFALIIMGVGVNGMQVFGLTFSFMSALFVSFGDKILVWMLPLLCCCKKKEEEDLGGSYQKLL